MDTKKDNQLEQFADKESRREDCFLCCPSAPLLAHVGEECYTMAGLGPLSDGYALIATYQHGPIENLHYETQLRTLAEYSEKVQKILAVEFGSCVLAEHGKMSVCNPNRPAGSHCFHPHFLLFPGAPDPLPEFNDYFCSQGNHFESLSEALHWAIALPNYLLSSSRPGEYVVFPAPDGLPRQFARGIVADALGHPDLASWQTYPNGEWAIRNAARLRLLLTTHELTKKSR